MTSDLRKPAIALLAIVTPSLIGGFFGWQLGQEFGGTTWGVVAAVLGALAGLGVLFVIGILSVQVKSEGKGESDADGRPNGLWTWTFPNGQRRQVVNFAAGVQQGPATSWHDNGQVAAEGEYRDGLQHGPWTFWHRHGWKQVECHYADGELHGPWRVWNAEGQLTLETHYDHGILHGAWTEWGRGGRVRRQAEYVHGVCRARGIRRCREPNPLTDTGRGQRALWLGLLVVCGVALVKQPYLLVGLVVFLAAVTIHELGHFAAAKLVQIPIKRFRVGIGPSLGRFMAGGVICEINLFPIIGYVQPYEMSSSEYAHYLAVCRARQRGEPEPPPLAETGDEPRRPASELVSRPKRLLFLLGGVLFNFVAAVLLMWGGLCIKAKQMASPITACNQVVDLAGQVFAMIPQAMMDGFKPKNYASDQPGLLTAIGEAAKSEAPKSTVVAANRPTTADEPAEAKAKLPPRVGLWRALGAFLLMFNILLFCGNLLPIPPLDGFHCLRLLVEAALRRTVPDKVIMPALVAGGLFLVLPVFGGLFLMARELLRALFR